MKKNLIIHLGVICLLFLLQDIFSLYHQGNFARILVLAVYGFGYNILFGYTGLLSLGHALFFAAGLYAAGLSIYHLDFTVSKILYALLCIKKKKVLSLGSSRDFKIALEAFILRFSISSIKTILKFFL